MPTKKATKDFLFLHIRELPYFRGLLRAVESRFYQGLEIPSPTLDVGCGDGNFAELTFDRKMEIGIDPWWPPIREAVDRNVYGMVNQVDGAFMPYPDAYFASAISNSVLEHIPPLDSVLVETARVLKPGAPFIFCVPNHNFLPQLSIARFFDVLGLKPLAAAYRSFFNHISRHQHCDDPETWRKRLEAAGFKVEKYWHYFSPAALATLEWGHYFGVPTLVFKKLLGRFILSPTEWNMSLTKAILLKYYNEPVPQEKGAYTFYIARRV
jgi:SAM-dependent methyltransferase